MKIKAFFNRQVDRLCGLASRLLLKLVGRLTLVVERQVRVQSSKITLRIARATASPEAARKAGQLMLEF